MQPEAEKKSVEPPVAQVKLADWDARSRSYAKERLEGSTDEPPFLPATAASVRFREKERFFAGTD